MSAVRDLRGKQVKVGDTIALLSNRATNPEISLGEVVEITTGASMSSSYGMGKSTTILKVEIFASSGNTRRFYTKIEAPLRRFVKIN